MSCGHPFHLRTQLQQELCFLARELISGNSLDPSNQQLINIRRSKLWQDVCKGLLLVYLLTQNTG